MKWIKKNSLFLTVLLLAVLVVFSKFLFTSTDYVIGYDTKNIYVPFYEEIRTLFAAKELPFWSHNFFLGGNILASKGYYFLGDLFSYFSIILPKWRIEDVLLVIQILKFILCTSLMYFTLKEMKIRNSICWFASALFTFSSWMLIFMGTPAFATFAAILPLLMLGIERYLNKKSFILVALASFLLVMDNFYLFWSVSFYLVLYWPFRYFMRNDFNKKNFIHFLKSTGFLILIYCLGVFAASFLLFPTVDYMVNVPRVSQQVEYSLLWESKKVYLDMFIKFISAPFYVNTSIPNLFGTQYYRTDQIALFSSSLIALILPQLFIVFSKREKVVLSIFLAINGIMLIFPFFGSLMHGFAEPSFRWTIMLVMALIILGAEILNRYEKINIPLLVGTIIFYLLGLAVILIYKRNELANYSSQLIIILISFILFAVYTFLLGLSKTYHKAIYIIGIIVCYELIGISKLSLDTYAKQFQKGYHYEELGIPKDYFSSFTDQEEFYRIYVNDYHVDLDHNLEFNYNSNMYYNFKGLYGYDSTTQYSTQDILNWSEEYFWWYKINNPILHNVLTTKYYVVQDASELPEGNFEFIENIASSKFSLYYNADYQPFGFSYGNIISTQKFFESVSIPEKTEVYKQAIIINQRDIDKNELSSITPNLQPHYLTNVVYSNNHITGDIQLDDKQLVFFSIPYDKGWTIKANGVTQDIILSEGGFMSIVLDKGEYHIELQFFPYGLKFGLIVSGISVAGLIALQWKRKKILNKIA